MKTKRRRKGYDMQKSRDYLLLLAKEIPPKLAYDAALPLNEWQEKAHEKLEELLGLPLPACEDSFRIIAESEGEDFKQIEFEFMSEPGHMVTAILRIPFGEKKPRPVVIGLQGHSTGAHVTLGIQKYPRDEKSISGGRNFSVWAVKNGYCAVAMEQRYMGDNGRDEKDGKPACLRLNASMGGFLLGRTAIGERVWDVHRLIDILITYFSEYICPDKIICMGNSGGGTTSFYAACYDKRVCLSVPSCAVCTYEASIMARHHCGCNYIPNIRNYFNMGDLGCLIAPRPLIVVCGVEDDLFPLHGVEKSYAVIETAYHAAGKDENCHLLKGNGGHTFFPDDVWPLVNEMMR